MSLRPPFALLLSAALVVFAPITALAQSIPQNRGEITLSFAPLVRDVAPAVANIYAERIVAERASPFAGDPFFGEFFRNFGQVTPRVQNSLGSGVILSEDGIIVSNYHVVGEAQEIRVVLSDRREFAADLILSDEESDLAILQLRDAAGLPFVQLQDSDVIEVGDLVLAIGNPFGVGQTVSSGIVSGLARSGIAVGSGRGYFIQTDAPINPGNSGGALVDMQGRLVGVNTAIITRSGGSHGIGFAIPSNLVGQVVAQARAGNNRFIRPWAGITAQGVDAGLGEAFGQEIPAGVVLLELHPDSPFAAAGMQRGDVVLSVDGGEVNSAPEMMFRLAIRGIGAMAEITYMRGESVQDVSVDLIAPPESPARDPRQVTANSALRGLSVVQINPAVIAEYGLGLDAEGVLVTQLRDWAARSGLRPGDILLAINGAQISTPEDVVRAADNTTRNWTVEVLRNGRRAVLRFRV